jgi:hypothetical protein
LLDDRLSGTETAADRPVGSVRRVLERLPADRFPEPDDLNALARERDVRSGGGAPLAFVLPTAGPGTAARRREERIFRTGEVATRPGSRHDLFNALAWLAFPHTKAVLNRLHHDELARLGEGPVRGTARDVATPSTKAIAAAHGAELAHLLPDSSGGACSGNAAPTPPARCASRLRP